MDLDDGFVAAFVCGFGGTHESMSMSIRYPTSERSIPRFLRDI